MLRDRSRRLHQFPRPCSWGPARLLALAKGTNVAGGVYQVDVDRRKAKQALKLTTPSWRRPCMRAIP